MVLLLISKFSAGSWRKVLISCVLTCFLETISSATFTSMRPERRNARVLLVDNPDVKEASNNKTYKCPLHRTDKHSIIQCYSFQKLEPKVRKLMVASYSLCFRCLGNHRASNCKENVKYNICVNENRVSIMHINKGGNRRVTSAEGFENNRTSLFISLRI